jgi:hypothetical protein
VAGRGYIVAVLLALGAGALVAWQLSSTHDTTCFLKAVRAGSVTRSAKEREQAKDATTYFINHCKGNRWETVVSHLQVDKTDELEAKSALVVWILLLAATAAFAAFVGVRAVAIIREVDPPRDGRFIGLCVGALALAAVPFLVYQGLHEFADVELSRFDAFEHPQLVWAQVLIAALLVPAIVGIEAIGRVAAVRPLALPEAARLGSRMRELLGMLGVILSLIVLDTGARSKAIDKLQGGEALPSTIVVLYGLLYVLVLALLYVPVQQRWATTTTSLISDEVAQQLSGASLPGTPGFHPSELSLKKQLSETLGVEGPLQSIRASVAVLSPVIAAAVASLFS